MPEDLPREFGRYRLIGLLGSGGMAKVYRAEASQPGATARHVAIKLIANGHLDRELDVMLIDEARIWRRLHHPNIVEVLEFGEHDDDWFLALELVEGCSLAEMLKGVDVLPVSEALCVAERLALALDHAHTRKDDTGRALDIVHRDIKPANILISREGQVKLTDFGIARAVDRLSRTQVGVIKGSVYFLSPEQARGEPVDRRSDLFSLGTVLHVMLTGTALIDMPEDDEILDALIAGRIPPPPPSLPTAVRELLSTLTAASPSDRPPDGAEVASRIRAVLAPITLEEAERRLGARVRGEAEDGPPTERVPDVDQERSTVRVEEPFSPDARTRVSDPTHTRPAMRPVGVLNTKSPMEDGLTSDEDPSVTMRVPAARRPTLPPLDPRDATDTDLSPRAARTPDPDAPLRTRPPDPVPSAPDRSPSRSPRPRGVQAPPNSSRSRASRESGADSSTRNVADTNPSPRARKKIAIAPPARGSLASYVILAVAALALGALAMLAAGPLYSAIAGR